MHKTTAVTPCDSEAFSVSLLLASTSQCWTTNYKLTTTTTTATTSLHSEQAVKIQMERKTKVQYTLCAATTYHAVSSRPMLVLLRPVSVTIVVFLSSFSCRLCRLHAPTLRHHWVTKFKSALQRELKFW